MKSGYYTRALKYRDQRFKSILDKMGYATRQMEAEPETDLSALRAEYTELMGKKPFGGWDEATIRQKMEEATTPEDEDQSSDDGAED